jgi:methylated-DNA-[protein]-cysteine S-methyltransferase
MNTAVDTFTHTVVPTATGPLTLVMSADTLVAAGFCGVDDLRRRLGHDTTEAAEPGPIGTAVAAYLAGDVKAIDQIAVRQPGTPLQQRVWDELRRIPVGTTVSYGELAGRLGLPRGASRAIGSACGANLIAPIVPCHRVVRVDGSLGGYAYGLSVKQWLLELERPEDPEPRGLW